MGIELSFELIALIVGGGLVALWVAKKVFKLVFCLTVAGAALYFLAPYAGLLF